MSTSDGAEGGSGSHCRLEDNPGLPCHGSLSFFVFIALCMFFALRREGLSWVLIVCRAMCFCAAVVCALCCLLHLLLLSMAVELLYL